MINVQFSLELVSHCYFEFPPSVEGAGYQTHTGEMCHVETLFPLCSGLMSFGLIFSLKVILYERKR